ncbi:MAG: hypothetical protein AB2604_01485 [Candidatus Thiodiazotropha taylori]|nr:hypothetical protein [Candidatus Thiodiazotropha taylori]
MKTFTRVFCYGVVLGLLSGYAFSNPPSLVNYQGFLRDADGSPVAASGAETHQIEVNIYADSAGTQLVWGPQVFLNVPVVNGRFGIILGHEDSNAVSIINALQSSERYIGIKVDTEPEIEPRQRILSAPYAISAGNGVAIGTVISSLLTPEQYALNVGDASTCASISNNSNCRWAYADGRSVQGSTYATIVSQNVPDMRDRFLRGKGTLSTSLGGLQDDATSLPNNAFISSHDGQHSHRYHHFGTQNKHWGRDDALVTDGTSPDGSGSVNYTESAVNHDHTIVSGGDTETRPINVTVNYFIRIN